MLNVKGRIVTHRFVHRQANGNLLTRGDANPVSDLEIRPDQVVGVYIRKSPFFTWMMSFGDLRKVLMLVVMLAISAVALYEARTVVLIGKEVHEEEIQLLACTTRHTGAVTLPPVAQGKGNSVLGYRSRKHQDQPCFSLCPLTCSH